MEGSKMEYIYAAMLLHKAGKPITEDSVKKILEAAEVAVNEAKVKALIAALEGVNIEEAIKKTAVAAAPVATAPAAGGSSIFAPPPRSLRPPLAIYK